MTAARPKNLYTLREVLPIAEKGGYAIGSFSPRVTPMAAPVLRAGQNSTSPLIVQISQKEFERYQLSPADFAAEFFRQMELQRIHIPVVLHLDHTKDPAVIRAAIAAGFTSVMIDASEKSLEDNIAASRAVVDYAHAHGVSVEAELGRIGTTDMIETDEDVEFYTQPEEAQRFVAETGVDALAVSVGTAHGVYLVRQPKIDYARLQAIRALTPVHLVIHGGSGIPSAMLLASYALPGGGVSKVNIATDLEQAALGALGTEKYLTDAAWRDLPAEKVAAAQAAVERTVLDKIDHYLGCAGKAGDFAGLLA